MQGLGIGNLPMRLRRVQRFAAYQNLFGIRNRTSGAATLLLQLLLRLRYSKLVVRHASVLYT